MNTDRTTAPMTVAAILVAALLTLAPTPVRAGARGNEIVALWMEPSGGDKDRDKAEKKAIKKCRKGILNALRQDNTGGETNITKGKRSVIAKRLKLDVPEFDSTWFRIPDKQYKAAFKKSVRTNDQYDEEDSVMLIECDPKNKLVRAVVHAPSGDVFRFRFHNIELDSKFIASIGESIVLHGIVGFSP